MQKCGCIVKTTIEEQCFALEKGGWGGGNMTNWSYSQNVDALSDREFKHSGHRPVQWVNYNVVDVVDVPANHVQDSTNQCEGKKITLPGDS